MRPNDVITALANSEGKKGHLWFSQPMTNIPIGKNDGYAGKFLQSMKDIMPPGSTVHDYLDVFLDVLWWLIFFAAMTNDEAFEKPHEEKKE
jgi:hypothetical protein